MQIAKKHLNKQKEETKIKEILKILMKLMN
jgi:hypothetical protein